MASTSSPSREPRFSPEISATSSFNPLGKPRAGEWGSSQPAVLGGIGGTAGLQLPGCSARSKGPGAGGTGLGYRREG